MYVCDIIVCTFAELLLWKTGDMRSCDVRRIKCTYVSGLVVCTVVAGQCFRVHICTCQSVCVVLCEKWVF